MTLNIPDSLLANVKLTQQEILVELAVRFYDQERLTRAQARTLAGVDDITLQTELERRGLGFDYDEEGFEDDLVAISKLKTMEK
jgi:predicted HTH domain antitoxin